MSFALCERRSTIPSPDCSIPMGERIYCHPQTDCFILSELFSVARHAGRSKPGWKPIQLIYIYMKEKTPWYNGTCAVYRYSERVQTLVTLWHFSFEINHLGKAWSLMSPTPRVEQYHSCYSTRMTSALNNPRRLICRLKQRN